LNEVQHKRHRTIFSGRLYGLNVKDPATGAADALRGAREMLARVAQLNSRLRGDLPQPMRIGIGIHFNEADFRCDGTAGLADHHRHWRML
jgi:hypothetical protein